MQRTFGTVVGLETVVPCGTHPDDVVVCSDGTELLRGTAYLDCRGCAHSTDEERNEADLAIVEEILNDMDEWITEYCTENTDYADGYHHIVQEVSHDWPVAVKEWIRDNYPEYNDGIVDALTEAVCDDLDGSCDWEPEFNRNEYAAYNGDGCCLWGTDIGEYEEQIDVGSRPEFEALAEDGRLVDILERVNCNAYVASCGLQWLKQHLAEGREYPCFYTYHCPGGRWDFVVSKDRMRQAVTTGIIGLCRA